MQVNRWNGNSLCSPVRKWRKKVALLRFCVRLEEKQICCFLKTLNICTCTDQSNNNKKQDAKNYKKVALEVCFSCNVINLWRIRHKVLDLMLLEDTETMQ